MSDRLFLIDGTALIFRSFFAIRNLSNSKGQPTNAVFGFSKALLKFLREERPTHAIMVFDAPGKTFRDDLYPEYKATRPPVPQSLIDQLGLIDDVVAAFELPVLRVTGVEADDVIGTMARRAEASNIDCAIVSGDKDVLQLVTNRIRVLDPAKGDRGAWFGPKEVIERFGVPPEHVVDSLALIGDAADNVPGVRGIGEKTARQLLENYGSLEGIYEHLDDLKGKQRERLEEDKESAFFSRQLVTIKTDVPLDIEIERCRLGALDGAKLADVFAKLEFQSLASEFLPSATNVEETDYRLVLTEKELDKVIEEMADSGSFSLDTETTSTDSMRAVLVGVSLSCRAGSGYYIPVGHTAEAMAEEANPDELLPREPIHGMTWDAVRTKLAPLLENEAVTKIGHNIKYDVIVLERAGVKVRGIGLDTMVASYLTDPSRLRHNLDEVSLHYLKRKLIPISDLIGKGAKSITFDRVPVRQACQYASEDADIAWRLAETFSSLLHTLGLDELYDKVEKPLLSVLARMEMAGIAIDVGVFADLRTEIETRLHTLEGEIQELAGEPFQINSPKQVQEVLFGRLGLKPIRKTKTGYSTDVDVLEELAREHPLPKLILDYRMYDKLRSTYVEALPRLVHPETGRVHTSFNQAVAATGRLSSSEPNLQNIPIRTEIGRRIRRGFVPGSPRQKLISADYSQIELRVLAHLSEDECLCAAFQADADIHRDTAARVFNTTPGAVTDEMRRVAKAVNFGVVYGISAFGLAKNLSISMGEAAKFIEQYFEQYPGVKRWIEKTIEKAREDGYVTTILNRRRYVPELQQGDANVVRAGERIAVNTPVQGSAADIIKVAMVRLHSLLAGRHARLLLQVHDELVLEADEREAAAVAELTREVMEGVVTLKIPVKVDVGIGDNWEAIH